MQCFVSTSHVNAWSIRKGLRRLGLDCRSLQPRSGLVPAASSAPCRGDTLFFTEEDSLLKHLGDGSEEYHFYPRSVPLPPDDKLAFADVMRGIGESPVPHWSIAGRLPVEPPVLPLVVKSRYSWRDGRKLPRGWVCATAGEYRDAGLALERTGLSPTDFLIQEFLPDADVVSTCGFFDALNPTRNIFLTTRKLLGQGKGLTTGVVVETIDDPAGLVPRTVVILDALRYRGPFELEFVRDQRRGVYHVLELNMRFWMQHGLFIDGCGNRLLERYLDRDDPRTAGGAAAKDVKLVWVDRLALIAAVCRRRWGFLWDVWSRCRAASLAGARIVVYPDAWATLRFCGLEAVRLVRDRLVRTLRRTA
jgi:hypothetical protein